MATPTLPDRKHQTVALIRKQGGRVEFVHDYPIPTPGHNEVVAQLLYTGVCQSGEFPSTFPHMLFPRLFSGLTADL